MQKGINVIGRRFVRRESEIPDRPGWRDYFQMATTLLMWVLGAFVLWQTLFVRWAVPSLIFSISLLLFALYRTKMVLLYFRQKGKRDDV